MRMFPQNLATFGKAVGCIGCQCWPNYQKYCNPILRLLLKKIKVVGYRNHPKDQMQLFVWNSSSSSFYVSNEFAVAMEESGGDAWMDFLLPLFQWNPRLMLWVDGVVGGGRRQTNHLPHLTSNILKWTLAHPELKKFTRLWIRISKWTNHLPHLTSNLLKCTLLPGIK